LQDATELREPEEAMKYNVARTFKAEL